jgi:CheY-like chemotaxis protein
VPRSALILGVDDDRLNLKVTKSVVEGLGYVFIEANSGAECLRVLETVQPHVILLDVMMPEMDGFETCRRVRQEFRGAGPRILYLTARNLVEDVKHSVETGADDYLVKPIQMTVLKARLKHWLKQPPRGAPETPPT